MFAARVAPGIQGRARPRAAREQPDHHPGRALPSVALNWTHTFGPSAINELLLGYTKVKFETDSTDWAGIGDANASVGIPGGQAIPGLSGFDIGDDRVRLRRQFRVQRHQDLPAHEQVLALQGTSRAEVRRTLAVPPAGLRLLGQRGPSRPLHYNGSFTGFAFADFLLDQVSAKGLGGLVEPFTHLQNRIGLFAQDDFRMRNDLTLNLGIAWEYNSPWVEKDDRQSNIDLRTGQLILAGQNGNSRALYDAYYGGFEPRVGFAWTPSSKWVVRGGFGIVQYMEGTGKNLRLTQNPPGNFEGRRVFDATTGPGTASVGFGDIVPQTSAGPGTLFRIFPPDLKPQITKQWNLFVERQISDSISAQIGYVGSRSDNMVVPFDFNQPEPGSGPPSTWAPLDQRRPLFPLNPAIGVTSGTNSIGVGAYDALAGEHAAAPHRGPGVPRLLHVQQGLERQRRLLRHGLGPDGGPRATTTWTAPIPGATTDGRTYDVRHNFTPGRHLRAAPRQGPQDRERLERLQERRPGRLEHQQHLPEAQRLRLHRHRRRRPVAAGHPLLGAAQPHLRRPIPTPAAPTTSGSTSAASRARRSASSADSGARHHDRPVVLEPGPRDQQDSFYVDDRRYFTLKLEAFNVLNHPNWGAPSSDFSDPTSFGRVPTRSRRRGSWSWSSSSTSTTSPRLNQPRRPPRYAGPPACRGACGAHVRNPLLGPPGPPSAYT